MSNIDLREIATDPEFMTSITRLRPTTTFVPNSRGKTRATYEPTPLRACVQASSRPDSTTPAPEGQRMDSWILIISAAQILMAGSEEVSDVVLYNGGKFRVMKVESYAEYGYFTAYAQEYHAATPTVVTSP